MATCKATIRTGYHLNNKEDVVGLDILNLINKRENSKPGNQFIFDLGTELTYNLADKIAITGSCGVNVYKVCECNEDTEIILNIEDTVSCSRTFSKCLSNLNGNDATKELTKRINEAQNQINADLVYTVIDKMKAGGTEVQADLSTTEGVIKYLEDVNASFDEAGYLQTWNPTNELGETSGSFNARYVFLDSVVYDKLRKAESTKCCKDLIIFPDVSERMQFMGMTIIRVPRLNAIHGVKALAFYAPHVLMAAKCEEQVDVMTDVAQLSQDRKTTLKYDLIMGQVKTGFKLVSPAVVQYVGNGVVTP